MAHFFFGIFHALSFKLNFFRPEFPLNSFRSILNYDTQPISKQTFTILFKYMNNKINTELSKFKIETLPEIVWEPEGWPDHFSEQSKSV